MLFIFDMGGVVTNAFDGDALFKNLRLSQDEFYAICAGRNEENIWDLLQRGRISPLEFWEEFNMRIMELDVPPVKSDLFRLFFHPKKNCETLEIVKALKAKHRVICATNTIQSHWENHLERGDYQFFDQTYASNKIGIAKPSVDFFKLVLQAENYNPDETFFTDDKQENCEGAKKAGIHSVVFKSAKELYSEWQKYF